MSNLPKSVKLSPVAVGGSSFGNPLPFDMQDQQQDQWCWAATAVSVKQYFAHGGNLTQCGLVNQVLPNLQTNCCQNGDSDECDQPWELDAALQANPVRNFLKMAARRATLDEAQSAIDSGSPLCVRIEWNNSGGVGHFVTIYGYSGQNLNIANPAHAVTVLDYDSFPEHYLDGAQWTHTYWTKP